jgi:hypothetical protein
VSGSAAARSLHLIPTDGYLWINHIVMPNIKKRVEASVRGQAIVRYSRSLDPVGVYSYGFAVASSSDWFLTHYIGDHLRLDGYDAVRMQDMTELDLDFDKADCLLECIAMKRQRAERPGGIDLAGARRLCESVASYYPLLVIHRELVCPGECEVGALKMVSDESYALRWLTPSAQWADDESVYNFADVTRVTFGGEYETTLAAVAGLIENPFAS